MAKQNAAQKRAAAAELALKVKAAVEGMFEASILASESFADIVKRVIVIRKDDAAMETAKNEHRYGHIAASLIASKPNDVDVTNRAVVRVKAMCISDDMSKPGTEKQKPGGNRSKAQQAMYNAACTRWNHIMEAADKELGTWKPKAKKGAPANPPAPPAPPSAATKLVDIQADPGPQALPMVPAAAEMVQVFRNMAATMRLLLDRNGMAGNLTLTQFADATIEAAKALKVKGA